MNPDWGCSGLWWEVRGKVETVGPACGSWEGHLVVLRWQVGGD